MPDLHLKSDVSLHLLVLSDEEHELVLLALSARERQLDRLLVDAGPTGLTPARAGEIVDQMRSSARLLKKLTAIAE